MDELNLELNKLKKSENNLWNDIKILDSESLILNEENQMKFTLNKQLFTLKQKKLKKEEELQAIRNQIHLLEERISKIK